MTPSGDKNPSVAVNAQPERLGYIDAARTLAVIAVVLIHTTAMWFPRPHWTSPGWWWFVVAEDSFSRWCVPVFVMISGAILLAPTRHETAGAFYLKRWKRIGIPTVFWSAFYLASSVLVWNEPFSYIQTTKALLTGLPAPHLHFMFVIAGLYAVTPLLRPFVASASRRELLAFSIAGIALGWLIFLTVIALRSSEILWLRFVPYVGYYLLGYVIRKPAGERVSMRWVAIFLLAGVGVTLSAGLLVRPAGGRELFAVAHASNSPLVAVMSAAAFILIRDFFANGAPLRPLWATLGPLVCGIYLMHPAFLGLIQFGPLDPSALPLPWHWWVQALFAFSLSAFASLILSRLPVFKRLIG